MNRPRLRLPSAVLYDLDGTLVDSLPDIAAAVDDVLAAQRLPVAGLDRIFGWVGQGVTVLMTHAMRHGLGGVEPDDAQIRYAVKSFHGAYGLCYCRHTRPYPGAEACLQAVHALGIPQAVVTNKPESFARAIVEQLGLALYLPVVVGGDTLPQHKPDPAPLLHACSLLGADAAGALMVGDSSTDARAAEAAGMPTVLVSYGYHGPDNPQNLPVAAFVDTLADLPGLWTPLSC